MSPNTFHRQCLKVKSSTADMYQRYQIIDPNHRTAVPLPTQALSKSFQAFWLAYVSDTAGKCSHHGFIGESIRGGLLDFFEWGLALLLSITVSIRESSLELQAQASAKCEHLRSSLLPLLPKVFNNPHHLFPPLPRIHLLPTQTHTHFLIRADLQQPLHQQMPHVQTHKNPTV
jgi:hypothetical protein